MKKATNGPRKTIPAAILSYGSISQMHQVSSTFDELRKKIDRHRTQFVRHLEMDIDPKELQMSRCWINVMPANVMHSFHLHPLSVLSGTYYVQTPANCSAIKFEDPRIGSFMASPPRKEKSQTCESNVSTDPAQRGKSDFIRKLAEA